MSEPIPESIPTSLSHASHRPTKKLRANTTTTTTTHKSPALSSQATLIQTLMSSPSVPLTLPAPTSKPSSYQPPEIVPNVQGSSAGAGSGEFHVYKASRRREYERVRGMEEEARREAEDVEWERGERERRERDERERERKKGRRRRGKRRGGKEKGKEKEGGNGGDAEGGTVDAGEKGQEGVVQISEAERGGDVEGGRNGVGDVGSGDVGQAHRTATEEIGVVIHDDD